MPCDEYEYWDLGDVEAISLADKPLANVLRTIILCDGKITDCHCMEKV